MRPSTVDSRPHAGSAAGAAIAALLKPTLPAFHEARCRQVSSGPDCASHWQSSTSRLCAQLAGRLLLFVWADGLTALFVPKQLAQGLAAMPCCGLQPAGPVGAGAGGLAHLTRQCGAAHAPRRSAEPLVRTALCSTCGIMWQSTSLPNGSTGHRYSATGAVHSQHSSPAFAVTMTLMSSCSCLGQINCCCLSYKPTRLPGQLPRLLSAASWTRILGIVPPQSWIHSHFNPRLSICPSMAPPGSTLLQASCFVLLAAAAVSGRRQLLTTDHTYVNNQSSRPIRGTTFYQNGNSQFVNRLIEPGAQGKVLPAPLLLAAALLLTTSSPWHVLAEAPLACALWACSVAHAPLKHVQAASISLSAVSAAHLIFPVVLQMETSTALAGAASS